jgi:hypothetical protein
MIYLVSFQVFAILPICIPNVCLTCSNNFLIHSFTYKAIFCLFIGIKKNKISLFLELLIPDEVKDILPSSLLHILKM